METDNSPDSSPTSSLHEQCSWCSWTKQQILRERAWNKDQIRREHTWTNRQISHGLGRRNSITHDDLDELRSCLDLGFRFDELPVDNKDSKLLSTLPALEPYLNSKSSDGTQLKSDSECFSELESVATSTTPSFIEPGEDPELVKKKLKEWAKMVGNSLRRLSADMEKRDEYLENLEAVESSMAHVFLD